MTCNQHPKAPHGFDRSSSHNTDQYVCDCENWDPYEAGFQEGLQKGLELSYEPWKLLTSQDVYDLIREGAAGGGWQGFAERLQTAFIEKNRI